MGLSKQIEDEAELQRSKLPVIEQIVLDYVRECRLAMQNNENDKFCKLVEMFKMSFPYSTAKTKEEMKQIDDWYEFNKRVAAKDQSGTVDLRDIHFQYKMMKYGAIVNLLKAKNIYPKPAEVEEW